MRYLCCNLVDKTSRSHTSCVSGLLKLVLSRIFPHQKMWQRIISQCAFSLISISSYTSTSLARDAILKHFWCMCAGEVEACGIEEAEQTWANILIDLSNIRT